MHIYDVEFEARLRCVGTMPGLTTVKYVGHQKFSASKPLQEEELEHYINWKIIRQKILGVRHLKFTAFKVKKVN